MAPKRALILGMIYSEETVPKRGQEFRDRVRCEALENRGYEVYTLDNKHDLDEGRPGRHCRANFVDSRRMLQSIRRLWGDNIQFDDIILDYFFSPAGWARERWSDGFFMNTIPLLKESGVLKPNGKMWLPWLECVDESLCEFRGKLAPSYDWKLVKDPWENPLFTATSDADPLLQSAPDTLVNANQLQYLLDYSDTPFCVMLPYWPKPGESPENRVGGPAGTSSIGGSYTKHRHEKRNALAVCNAGNAAPLTKVNKNLVVDMLHMREDEAAPKKKRTA
jgi:hypothetical protein